MINVLNQEKLSLVRLFSRWFNYALYTPVFKFPPGGGPILDVV